MARRLLALALWAYFGWFLASFLTAWSGVPSALAPLGAVAMAGLALVDWRELTARSDREPDPPFHDARQRMS